MFGRRSSTHQARRPVASRLPTTDEVRDQVAEVTDELGEALDAAKDALGKAISSAGRRGTAVGAEATRRTAVFGKEAGRKGMAASKVATRRARGATLDVVGRRLPEPDEIAEMTRRAAEKLFPERAKHHRKAVRRRRRRLLYGGAGLACGGMLMGWLTAPKKGDETRQVLKERANAAGGRVAELRASAVSQRQRADTTTTSGMVADSGLGSGSMAGSGTGAGTAGSGGSGAGAEAQGQQGADVTPIHPGEDATSKRR